MTPTSAAATEHRQAWEFLGLLPCLGVFGGTTSPCRPGFWPLMGARWCAERVGGDGAPPSVGFRGALPSPCVLGKLGNETMLAYWEGIFDGQVK